MMLVVALAALVVLAVCLVFTLHRDYHAGVVGTLGLMLLGLGAFARLVDVFERGEAALAPFHAMVWIGLALFLGRQAWVWWCRRGSRTWYAPAVFCPKVDPEATVPQSARSRAAGGFARITILPTIVVAMLIGFGAAMLLYPIVARSEPLYAADIADAKVIIHSDACALEAVGNLPRRATWSEMKKGGATFEGCCGKHPHFPIMLCYFAGDRSVVVIHSDFFERVAGT